jgi:hypothetical protein
MRMQAASGGRWRRLAFISDTRLNRRALVLCRCVCRRPPAASVLDITSVLALNSASVLDTTSVLARNSKQTPPAASVQAACANGLLASALMPWCWLCFSFHQPWVLLQLALVGWFVLPARGSGGLAAHRHPGTGCPRSLGAGSACCASQRQLQAVLSSIQHYVLLSFLKCRCLEVPRASQRQLLLACRLMGLRGSWVPAPGQAQGPLQTSPRCLCQVRRMDA